MADLFRATTVWKDESYFTGDENCSGYGNFDTLEEAKKYIALETGENNKVVFGGVFYENI